MPDDDGEFITRAEVAKLLETVVEEVVRHLDRRRGGGDRMTTGIMATTTTVILDDDSSATPLATIGTAAASARVLCFVAPPTGVYVVRTL